MEVTKDFLIDFIKSLPDEVKANRENITKHRYKKWDYDVRHNFANFLTKLFQEKFGSNSDIGKYVYVEGCIKANIQNKKLGDKFFGARTYPDAALISSDNFKIAIELDHGKTGSKIRNALAKAAFSKLLGKYDQVLLLFFIDQEVTRAFRPVTPKSPEEEILNVYQDQFATTLHIISK